MKHDVIAPAIMVFDFDGTITRIDIFKLLIFIRCLQPNSWRLIIKALIEFRKENSLSLRQSLYRYLWPTKKARLMFFDRFFQCKTASLLIRQHFIELINRSVGHKKILILSANEGEILRSFIDAYFPLFNSQIDLIATNSLTNEKPYKGRLKVQKYRSYLQGLSLKTAPIIMHSFFDSKTDFLLAKQSNIAVNLNKCHDWFGVNVSLGFITISEYNNRYS